MNPQQTPFPPHEPNSPSPPPAHRERGWGEGYPGPEEGSSPPYPIAPPARPSGPAPAPWHGPWHSDWQSHWRPGERPHWWPEGEPWPPRRKPGRKSRSFLRKVGCFFGVILGLMLTASILGAIFSDGGGRHNNGGPPWWLFLTIIMVVSLAYVGRTVRSTAAPISEVMSAAERVADGDYTVRVETEAKGDVGRLVETFNAMTTRLETNETQRRNLFADPGPVHSRR